MHLISLVCTCFISFAIFYVLEYNNIKVLESQDLQDVISPNVKAWKKIDCKDGKTFLNSKFKFAHFWVIMNNEPCMGVLTNKTLKFRILKYNPSFKSIGNIVIYVNEKCFSSISNVFYSFVIDSRV
jgi:hypothetical protein